jgi:hypothetical protein
MIFYSLYLVQTILMITTVSCIISVGFKFKFSVVVYLRNTALFIYFPAVLIYLIAVTNYVAVISFHVNWLNISYCTY